MKFRRKITGFWYSHNNIIAKILAPLGYIYSQFLEMRIRFTMPAKDTPLVICVGNFVIGGAGKTPLTIAIAERLARTKLSYCILTRGYLGHEKGPIWVNPQSHNAIDVGDEALLLAERAPTLVSKNRRDGFYAAQKKGYQIIIMDDGFQNPTVYKHITFIAMDAGAGVGNGHVFPAGPLRMRLSAQLPMSSAIISIGDGFGGETVVQKAKRQFQIPRFKAFYEAERNLRRFAGRRVIAFCGIGRPSKFIETLEDAGVEVVEQRFFSDHHNFTEKEAEALIELAKKTGLHLLTTEKDLVRIIPNSPYLKELKEKTIAIKISLTFDDNAGFNRFLKSKLEDAVAQKKKTQPQPIAVSEPTASVSSSVSSSSLFEPVKENATHVSLSQK